MKEHMFKTTPKSPMNDIRFNVMLQIGGGMVGKVVMRVVVRVVVILKFDNSEI